MGRGDRAGDRVPDELRPGAGESGLLSAGLADVAYRSVQAWERFFALASEVDMWAPTRSHGNRARDLIVPLGNWPDSRSLADMVADAHAGRLHTERQSQADDRLREAHRGDSDAAILEAVQRAVTHLRSWFASGTAQEQAHLVTPSPLGPVPIGTIVHATAFQLAVSARDLRPAGASPCTELDEYGVVAIVDSAGAVAARLGAAASIAAYTPATAVGTGTGRGGWRTLVLPPDRRGLGPAVQGPAETLVDVAAGRVDFLQVARHVRLRHPRRLVDMSIILEGIPELPAATMLRRAAAFIRALPF